MLTHPTSLKGGGYYDVVGGVCIDYIVAHSPHKPEGWGYYDVVSGVCMDYAAGLLYDPGHIWSWTMMKCGLLASSNGGGTVMQNMSLCISLLLVMDGVIDSLMSH